jgi:hypothetical protein
VGFWWQEVLFVAVVAYESLIYWRTGAVWVSGCMGKLLKADGLEAQP